MLQGVEGEAGQCAATCPHMVRCINQLVSYMTFTCRLRRRSNLARAAMFCIVVLQTGSRGLEGRGSQSGCREAWPTTRHCGTACPALSETCRPQSHHLGGDQWRVVLASTCTARRSSHLQSEQTPAGCPA